MNDLDDIADSINDINELEKLMASTLRKSQTSDRMTKLEQIKP